MMSMPRCGVKDKVGMDMSKNHTENPNHRHPRRSKRYALQGRNPNVAREVIHYENFVVIILV